MRPRVHTEKHYVQISLATVGAGVILNNLIALAVVVPGTTASDVREGCTISAVYVEMWIVSDDAALGSSIITLEKIPGPASFMNAADSAALNAYGNKKNVFYTQMGLTPPATQYPMATVKGWFKIPKGKQRFGQDDSLALNVHAQSNGLSVCGFMTYKEQF